MVSSTYDALFRQVNREIWIVTSSHGSHHSGLIATWVSQASIDPIRPFVLLGIAPNHFTGELIEASGSFVVHLPARSQAKDILPFGIGSGKDRDKLAGWDWEAGSTGAPRLKAFDHWLECRTRAVLHGGDRLYVWGEAVDGGVPANSSGFEALCERDLFAAATPQELKLLKENREHDSALHGPWFSEWLKQVAGGQSIVQAPTPSNP